MYHVQFILQFSIKLEKQTTSRLRIYWDKSTLKKTKVSTLSKLVLLEKRLNVKEIWLKGLLQQQN